MNWKSFFFVIIGLVAGVLGGCFWHSRTTARQTAPDTVWRWQTRYVPSVAETIRVAVPSEVDTQYVIQTYYTQKVYHDTVVDNDTLKLIVNDTVWQNTLQDRTVSLTFNAGRFVKANSVGIATAFGYRQADLMAVYRHKRWQLSGGWNFAENSPVVGAGYTIKEW